MIVIKINKCPFSLLIAISITKESPSKPRPWQAKARISKIESLFSCLLVPLHCTRSRNTRSLLQNLIRSTKGPGKARFYLKPLVEVIQAIRSLVVIDILLTNFFCPNVQTTVRASNTDFSMGVDQSPP